MQADHDRWLVGSRSSSAPLRLFCFHHAGGGASSYRPWQARFGDAVDVLAVQLPGRETRFDESPLRDFDEAVALAAAAIAPFADRPFALFGHSMGAMLAYEVAWTLEQRGRRARLLAVSGADAPATPRTMREADTDDNELQRMLRVNGTTDAALSRPAVLAFLLRALRADLRLLDNHRPDASRTLSIPLLTLCGRADPLVDVRRLSGWAAVTTAPATLRLFDGDHFYLRPHEAAVCDLLHERLGTPRPREQDAGAASTYIVPK